MKQQESKTKVAPQPTIFLKKGKKPMYHTPEGEFAPKALEVLEEMRQHKRKWNKIMLDIKRHYYTGKLQENDLSFWDVAYLTRLAILIKNL